MPLKVLLVDDHIMMTDFYKSVLTCLKREIEITTANTLETAYNFIFSKNQKAVDVAILDLSMPAYTEKNINNGEDLAKQIRANYPEIKIIFVSGIFTASRLNQLIKNICPEGIIEKGDIDCWDSFLSSFSKIADGGIYKSKRVQESIKNCFCNDTYFDETNRQIILLISQGIKTTNISNYLPLTLSAINKRKSKIKQQLQIENGDDKDIIRESQKRGLI